MKINDIIQVNNFGLSLLGLDSHSQILELKVKGFMTITDERGTRDYVQVHYRFKLNGTIYTSTRDLPSKVVINEKKKEQIQVCPFCSNRINELAMCCNEVNHSKQIAIEERE